MNTTPISSISEAFAPGTAEGPRKAAERNSVASLGEADASALNRNHVRPPT